MWKNSLRLKSTEFKKCQLKTVKGELPKKFEGRLFRNGPGVLGRGNQLVQHWFLGNGAMLEIEFVNGECHAQYRHITTSRYVEEEKSGTVTKFSPFKLIKNLVMKSFDPDEGNPANTSVLPVPNSNIVYALCEAGSPYRLTKDTLECQGFDKLGYLQSAYSAHPKIDPENGDVYNFGMRMNGIKIYRSSSDLKTLLASADLELREVQSIHDCVLAGKYIILFEYPIVFDKKWMLLGYGFLDCALWAPQKYNTLIHVFDKKTLAKVTTLETAPLYNYHFSNGFCNDDNEIVLEYCSYPAEGVPDLFEYLKNFPRLATDKKTPLKYSFSGYFEEMRINLTTKEIKKERNPHYVVEFPVVSDRLVGKEWRYTYAAMREEEKQPDSFFNSVCRYDRQTKKAEVRRFGSDNAISEPVLVEQQNGSYLITVVYHSDVDKSMVHLLDADTLQDVFIAEMPEVIPQSYHGRWDYDKIVR